MSDQATSALCAKIRDAALLPSHVIEDDRGNFCTMLQLLSGAQITQGWVPTEDDRFCFQLLKTLPMTVRNTPSGWEVDCGPHRTEVTRGEELNATIITMAIAYQHRLL